MRKRNIQAIVRFDKGEHERLKKLVKRSGVSQEVYIRHLIEGVVPADMPPPDYFSMMKELRQIGNNLNQIAQKAHVLNALDLRRYDEAVRSLDKAVLNITNAVTTPRKIERKTE
jgi:predicted DNA-binding protein